MGKSMVSCIVLILASTLCCWSCSESSSSKMISGVGPAGLSNATVFLDLNGDYLLDEGEVSAQTAEDGTFELDATTGDLNGNHLVLLVDEDTLWTDTGMAPTAHFAMISTEYSTISVFTTILAAQSEQDEAALKTTFGITEDSSLVDGYAAGGEIDTFLTHALGLYGDLYAAAASETGSTRAQQIDETVRLFLEDATLIGDYVAAMESEEPLPPTNDAATSVYVGDEIFQSIPVDAATMSFGVGMNEITRQVISGSFCLNVPEADAVPELAMSQNTRSYLFRLVKSEKDLRELLNVGGGLDLGTTMVQGSLEGRFINEFKSDTQSVYALIKAEYILSGYKLFGVGLDDVYLQDNADVASYTSNYSAFRVACGDRYLDQVTTGGAYYGLLKITASSSDAKKDLTVKLEGKYGKGPVSVAVKGDLQSSIEESLSNTSISIVVGSRGVSPEYLGLENADNQLIDNLDDFFNAADQFIDAISDPTNECHNDATAFRNCAYTVSFADYATITGGIPRFQTQVENLNFTTRLMGQYEDYKILESYISTMLVKRADYDWTGFTVPAVYAKKTQLARGKLIMDAAFRKCTTDFTGCTNNPDAKRLQTFNEIIGGLPFEAWREPRDCRDIQRLLGAEDVEGATVALGGDPTKLFQVSCARMATSEPETYLDIFNTSGSADSLTYNMARNVNPDGSTVGTAYQKLRVNVNYNDLEIINDQESEQETLSTAANDSPTLADNFAQARLGTAVDCFATPDTAITNIDLTNTGFRFADDLDFTVDTHPMTRYEWVNTVMTWTDANDHAAAAGGHLVVIDSLEEFETLKQLLIAEGHNNVNSWVGLTRDDLTQPTQYQQFTWVTTGTNLTGREQVDYFYGNEPNNCNNNESCVHFWKDRGLELNDLNCATTMPFLIEYETTQPTGEATISTDGISLDAWVNGTTEGQCVEIRPNRGAIRLIYND